MALNSGDGEFIQSLMTHLTSTDPGLASLLIDEHKREYEESGAALEGGATSLETAANAGSEILDALRAWQRGLGRLYSVLGPVDSAGSTRALRIGLQGRYIVSRWYHGSGKQKEPPVSGISFEEAHDGGLSDWSLFGMGVPSTALRRWVFTKSYLVRSMANQSDFAEFTVSSTDAVRELTWDFAISASGQSRFRQVEVSVQGMLDYIGDNELGNCTAVQLLGTSYSIDEVRAVEKHLKELL